MPTIAFMSKVRTSSEHCNLTLNIRHRIVVGQPSEIVHLMKLSLPEPVDVLLASQLLITISGMLNGARIPPDLLVGSCIARHVLEYLRLNAHELGINAVSNTYISGDTGLLTFSCAGARPFPATTNALHITLVGFDLDYIWRTEKISPTEQTMAPQMTAKLNPFSCRLLSLPYLTAVNNVIKRFVIFQLVKRYPLIFGPWCQQLDVETHFFSSISSSVARIVARSPHPEFQRTCLKLLKLCRKQLRSSSLLVAATLSDYLKHIGDTSARTIPASDEEMDSIVATMEKFYRLGLRRPLFKGLSAFCVPEDKEDAFLFEEPPKFCDDIVFETNSGLKSHEASTSWSADHRLDSEDEEMYLERGDGSFGSDSLDQFAEPEYVWPYSPCHRAKLLSRSPDRFSPIGSPDGFSYLDMTEGQDSDNALNFRDRLRSESPDNWYEDKGMSAELNLRRDISSSRCDRSADNGDSQEKLNISSMGMALAPNVESFEPHKLPRSRLARINEFGLDLIYLEPSSHHEFRPSPFNCTGDINDTESVFFDEDIEMFSDSIDVDAKENWLDIEALTTSLQFYCDSDTDSYSEHRTIGFSSIPNAGALSLGTDMEHPRSAVIPPEDCFSFGTRRPVEPDSITDEQERSLEAPGDHGFLAVDFD